MRAIPQKGGHLKQDRARTAQASVDPSRTAVVSNKKQTSVCLMTGIIFLFHTRETLISLNTRAEVSDAFSWFLPLMRRFDAPPLLKPALSPSHGVDEDILTP